MFVTNFKSPKASAKVDGMQTKIKSLKAQLHSLGKKLEENEIPDRRRDYEAVQANLDKTREELAQYLVTVGKSHLIDRID